ncbi:hypothetical protein [Lentzea indica]|uniref:hypothetical protein n=1 Tax=Lentzea indica TaxID=2604800 RepID=UPI001439A3B3|nr:hypothetical protein [Lentzea indica]
MRIVATGGTGNVGTALRRQLEFEDAGVDVRALSSLRDAVRGADVVVHLAFAIKPTDRDTNIDAPSTCSPPASKKRSVTWSARRRSPPTHRRNAGRGSTSRGR